MTLAQALQLYVPLAGLCMLCFWVGVLSQRVRVLEREAKDLREEKIGEKLTRLTTLLEGQGAQLASLTSAMVSVQRQMGNLMTTHMRGGMLVELSDVG